MDENILSGKNETYGVKLPSESKQKLQELIENSGQTAKDFFENLIANYAEKQMVGQLDGKLAATLKQTENHQLRIKEILIELVKSFQDEKNNFENKITEINQKNIKTVENLNEQIINYKKQLADAMLKKQLTEEIHVKTNARNIELEESHRTHVKTIALLEKTVTDAKKQLTAYESLKEDYNAEKESNWRLHTQIESLTKQVSDLENQCQTEKEQHQKELLAMSRELELYKKEAEKQLKLFKEQTSEQIKQLKAFQQKELANAQLEKELAVQVAMRSLESEHKKELAQATEKYELCLQNLNIKKDGEEN